MSRMPEGDALSHDVHKVQEIQKYIVNEADSSHKLSEAPAPPKATHMQPRESKSFSTQG